MREYEFACSPVRYCDLELRRLFRCKRALRNLCLPSVFEHVNGHSVNHLGWLFYVIHQEAVNLAAVLTGCSCYALPHPATQWDDVLFVVMPAKHKPEFELSQPGLNFRAV